MAWEAERAALLQQRDTIYERLHRSGDYGLDDAMADNISELSMYDNHPADVATELFERGKDVALRDRDHISLQEIDRALEAMERDDYGTCGMCQQPISSARLEAYPTSLLCVNCKRIDETRHPSGGRPVEEEVLWPGFGRSNLDDTTAVMFDGEDAWQAVGRFNERPGWESFDETTMNDLDDNEGIVDAMDVISNEQYKDQLP